MARAADLALAVAPVARELEGGADRGGDLRAGGDRADVAGPARAALGRTCARIQAHKRTSERADGSGEARVLSCGGGCTPLATAQRVAMKSHINLRGGERHQDRLHGAQLANCMQPGPRRDSRPRWAIVSMGRSQGWGDAWLERKARCVRGSKGRLRASLRRAVCHPRRRMPPQEAGVRVPSN